MNGAPSRSLRAADYVLASPFGLVPCPTLLVVMGSTLAIETLRPRSWTVPLVLPLIHADFRARELIMGSSKGATLPRGLRATTEALGWGVLAEVPGREVVMGAVTRPWEANVTFRALPPGEFAAFDEPGFVKIAWTLRADPVDARTSIFCTETRAVATDAAARARFGRYWSWASPGMALIRRLSRRPLKREAERRARTR
jgi:hypothetical protein